MEEILKRLNFQPASLTETDLANPEQVLATFFENYPIHVTRENLWQMYKGWNHHAAEYADTEQFRSMMSFYIEIIDLVNAAFVFSVNKTGDKF